MVSAFWGVSYQVALPDRALDTPCEDGSPNLRERAAVYVCGVVVPFVCFMSWLPGLCGRTVAATAINITTTPARTWKNYHYTSVGP